LAYVHRLVALRSLAFAGYKWWTVGIAGGDFDYAGAVVGLAWGAFAVAVAGGREYDPSFSRGVLIVGVLLAVPPLVWHLFETSDPVETFVNVGLLLTVVSHTLVQLMRRPAANAESLDPNGG
jgi:hypothetical protein